MNKTKDGRFIEKRVRISLNLLNKIIKRIKKYNNFTWRDFSGYLGICEQTARHDWLKKGNTIPLSIFKKLMKLHPTLHFSDIQKNIKILDKFWGQKLGNKSKFIKIPDKYSEDFAEFYGILLGDGCVYSNYSGFCITGNSVTDKEYYERYIKELIWRLFNREPKIHFSKQSNTIRCWLYSKKISNFLIKNNFPIGKKKLNKINIPKFIIRDKKLLARLLRGLFDTDGTICSHPHSKIMIQISITIPELLSFCAKGLKKLGINAGEYNKGINMYGHEKIKNYFRIIGSSNPKHLIKYNLFLKTSKVPTNAEIESFLKNRKDDM